MFVFQVSFGWSRPFMVKQIFPYGAVEITLLDGTNAFKVNRQGLKAYLKDGQRAKFSMDLM